jgi:hypothetical protein
MRTTGFSIIALAAVLAPVIGQAQGVEIERSLDQRFYVAEVPPGGEVRVGVKLPRDSLIAKTSVFVDSTDKGQKMDWKTCNIDTRKCEIGDARIVGFVRAEKATWEELAVNVTNSSDQVRYAKVQINFQPQAGEDESGCGEYEKCGFSEVMSSK